MDARHKLIDLAAFMDRVERATNAMTDFRIKKRSRQALVQTQQRQETKGEGKSCLRSAIRPNNPLPKPHVKEAQLARGREKSA